MRIRFPALLIVIAMAASCRDSGDAYLVGECKSPSGALNAVSWYAMGGGAAGWVYQYLSVVPGDRPTSAVLKKNSVAEGLVLRMPHVQELRLLWRDAKTLMVEYPDTAAIEWAGPGGVYTPTTPDLKVIYRGVPAWADEKSHGTLVCGASAPATTPLTVP